MFAIIAAVLFAIGGALDILDVGGDYNVLMWGGLFCVALHLALGTPIPWRRNP